MFIVSLTYTAPLEQIDNLLEEHMLFLQRKFADGVFIASGRKIPRTGGVILSKASDTMTLQQHLAEDPFYRNNVASYEIIEFSPSLTATGFEALLGA